MTRTARRAALAGIAALAAVLAIIAADFAASVSAQTDEEIAGRIVARRLDDGRVEFGWLPLGGRAFILPEDRYVPSGATQDAWLSSSPVEMSDTEIGRINANLRGDGRIEFAFTPPGGERILTEARYFPATARPNRWLRSTKITFTANTPPVPVGSISDIALDVGDSERVDVGPNFRDADGDRLTYSVDSDNTAVIWSLAGSVVTVEGVSAGSATLTVTAADPHGASAPQSFRVTVGSVPVIDSINCTPSEVRPEQTVTCTAQLSGGELDRWNWSDSGGSSASCTRDTQDAQAWECVEVTHPSFIPTIPPTSESYSTTFSQTGSQSVSLTVGNSAGSDSDDVIVIVNTPPETVGAISDITLDVGESETVDVRGNFRDADGDRLTYEADSDNSAVWESVSGSSVTVEGRRAGSATITVTADDGNGGTVPQWFDVTVNGEGEPVIDSISCSPSSPSVDQSVTCRASLSGGDPDTYSWSDSDGGSSSGPRETTYRTSFSSSGTKTVRLTASNSAGSDSGSTTVTVGNISCVIHHARSNVELSAVTLYQSAFNSRAPNRVPITVTCSDPAGDDNDLVLSSTSGDSEIGWVRGLDSSYTTFRPGRSYGATTVTITATAPDGRAGSVSVTVTALPVTGVVSVSCSPASPEVGESVTCTATLDGSPTPDSYSWTGGYPGDSAPSATLTTYSTRFSSVGDHTVRMTVRNDYGNDGSTSSGNQTTVTVVRGVGKPVINSISCSPSSPTVSQSVTCSANLSGDPPTSYSWSGGVSSDDDPTTTYNTTFSTPGTKTVSLTVSNSAGSDNESATLSVKSRRPNCGLGRGLDVEEGGSATISYTCSDPDGDTLTITATSGAEDVATVVLSSSTYTSDMTVTGTGVSVGRAVIGLVATDGTWEIVNTADIVVVEAPTTPPPVINSISCPSSVAVNQSVTCTVSLSGGTPTSYSWSGGASNGSSSTYSTSFSSSGTTTVSLTVSNSAGSDSDSTSVVVSLAPPQVNSISCQTPAMTNQYVTCTASLSGGTPDSYSWSSDPSFGVGSNNHTSFDFHFNNAGRYTISLTVSNSAGSHNGSIPLTVTGSSRPSCWNGNAEVSADGNGTLFYDCSDPDGDTLTITATSSDTNVATVALSSSTYAPDMTVTVTGVSVGRAVISLWADDGHWRVNNTASVVVR